MDDQPIAEVAKLTNEKQIAFLAAYRGCSVVSKAAIAAGVGRSTHYEWLQSDPEYAAAYDALRASVCRQIEDSLVTDLIEGVEEPIVSNGEIIGYRRKIDNRARIAYLDRHDKRFREAALALKSNGATVNVMSNVAKIEPLSDEEKKAMFKLCLIADGIDYDS